MEGDVGRRGGLDALGPSVRILAGEGRSHVEVMRSHFYGVAGPVDEAGVTATLSGIRGRFPKARHVVYAWTGPPASGLTRSSDDGEPHGTGGIPCLSALRREGIEGSLVAVARVFGGALLGAANLGRVYGRTAQEAVEQAGVRRLRLQTRLEVRVPMALVGRVDAILHDAMSGAVEVTYEVADPMTGSGAVAVLRATVPAGSETGLVAEVAAQTQGRARTKAVGESFFA